MGEALAAAGLVAVQAGVGISHGLALGVPGWFRGGGAQRNAARGGALENLAHQHCRHGGEEGDAEGGEGILPLGHRQTRDHAGAEAGHCDLAGDFAAGARGGSHASDASGGKLPAVAGPEHGGRRSCYRLFRNFMVPLQQPRSPAAPQRRDRRGRGPEDADLETGLPGDAATPVRGCASPVR